VTEGTTKPAGHGISVLIRRKKYIQWWGVERSKKGDDLLSGVSSSVVHAFYASVALHALSL
jgi:hypothetical protein